MSGIVGSLGSKSGVIGTTEIHYEEGTYEVTFAGFSGTCPTDTTRNTLAYTRIGNRCWVQGYARVADVTSPTGEMRINLPFTSAQNNRENEGNTWGHVVLENIGSGNVGSGFDLQVAGLTTWGYIRKTGAGNTAANYESSASSFIDYTNATFGFSYNISTFDHLV